MTMIVDELRSRRVCGLISRRIGDGVASSGGGRRGDVERAQTGTMVRWRGGSARCQ